MEKPSPAACWASADSLPDVTATDRFLIVGAGPTGSLLALGLARQGFNVLLVDHQARPELSERSRAYALTHSSRRLLQRLDVWDQLQCFLSPFESLRLDDRVLGLTAWFRSRDLRPGNRGSEAIGWILDHKPLMTTLLNELENNALVNIHFSVDSRSLQQQREHFNWTVAADGSRSTLRRSKAMPFWSHSYEQGCFTAKVFLDGAEQRCAYELFRAEGPMAVLPLGGKLYQVVWSAPLQHCRERLNLQDHQLLQQLAAVLPVGIRPTALLDQPGAFPLELSLAPQLNAADLLLVGESGHRCHPVGGQGLNLCWRDVSDLLDLTKSRTLSGSLPSNLGRLYTWRRLPDLISVLLSTDLLIRLFSNRQPLMLPVRFLIIKLLAQARWVRRVSLSAMTDGPGTLLSRLPECGQRIARHGDQQRSTTPAESRSAQFSSAENGT